MSIKYRKVRRKIMNGPEKGTEKTYAVAKASYYCDLDKLCNLVAARTALSDSEVTGIIKAFIWVINTELLSGAIVKIGDLCNIRYNLESEGCADPEEFKAHMIKRAKVFINPGVLLKKSARDVKFEQDEVKTVVETEDCNRPHAG